MASLNTLSFSQIVQNAAAAVQSAASALVDFTVGSILLSICEAAAGVGLWIQAQITAVLLTTRLATSTGTDCDTFGNDFAFYRLPANYATGQVTLSRYSTTAGVLVPAGSILITADGTQSFSVSIDTTNSLWSASQDGFFLPAGTASVTVPVMAINPGTQGNVTAGSITLSGSSLSIDVISNTLAFTNGLNAETDAAFQARFVNYINTRSLATPLAVMNAIQNVQQGLTYTVQENVSASGVYQPGNFVITVDDGSGDPSSTLIETISTAVNDVRPIGSTYSVLPPSDVVANVSMTITSMAGYTKSALQGPVAIAIETYINALGVGQPLPYSILAKLAYDAIPGIANVTSITLNGGTADIGGGVTQSVHPGTVAIN